MKKIILTLATIFVIFLLLGIIFKVLSFLIYIGFIFAAGIAIYIFFKYLAKK